MSSTDVRDLPRGPWVDRLLLLAVLATQVLILVQLRSGGIRHDTERHPHAADRAEPRAETSFLKPVPSPQSMVAEELGAMMASADAMMADAVKSAARLKSAVHFRQGWDVLGASPTMDMRDADGGYVVTFSLPGARDVGVELEGRVLTVRAICGAGGRTGHHGYERRVLLPGPVGSADQAQASLTNGILRIHVPKGSPASLHGSPASMRLF